MLLFSAGSAALSHSIDGDINVLARTCPVPPASTLRPNPLLAMTQTGPVLEHDKRASPSPVTFPRFQSLTSATQSSPSALTPFDQLSQILVPRSGPSDMVVSPGASTFHPRQDSASMSVVPIPEIDVVPLSGRLLPPEYSVLESDGSEATRHFWVSPDTMDLPVIAIQELGLGLIHEDMEDGWSHWSDQPETSWCAYDCDGYLTDDTCPHVLLTPLR